MAHPSIGTAGDLATRRKESDALADLQLTRFELEPLLLSHEELQLWNYLVDIPVEWGPGGESPSADGELFNCERCKMPYVVRPLDRDAAIANACTFHWGRALYKSVDGESPSGSSIHPG